jgi:hypothetical protein
VSAIDSAASSCEPLGMPENDSSRRIRFIGRASTAWGGGPPATLGSMLLLS